jgi:hypothetical protein
MFHAQKWPHLRNFIGVLALPSVQSGPKFSPSSFSYLGLTRGLTSGHFFFFFFLLCHFQNTQTNMCIQGSNFSKDDAHQTHTDWKIIPHAMHHVLIQASNEETSGVKQEPPFMTPWKVINRAKRNNRRTNFKVVICAILLLHHGYVKSPMVNFCTLHFPLSNKFVWNKMGF